MNIERAKRQIHEADIANQVISLAGLDVETALVPLVAQSDEQRNYGGDLRISGISTTWEYGLREEYRTKKYAHALISMINRHTSAKWWIEHQSDAENHQLGFMKMAGLKDEFKEELANAEE